MNERPYLDRAVSASREYNLGQVDLDALFLGILETDCRARSLVREVSEDFQVTLDRCRGRLRRLAGESDDRRARASDEPLPWSADARSVVSVGDDADSLELLRRLMAQERFYHNWAARRLARDFAERNMGRYQLDAAILRLRRESPGLS